MRYVGPAQLLECSTPQNGARTANVQVPSTWLGSYHPTRCQNVAQTGDPRDSSADDALTVAEACDPLIHSSQAQFARSWR